LGSCCVRFFTFGLGAIAGPLLTGWAMQGLGPFAFWLVLGGIVSAIELYAIHHMTQCLTTPVDETESYLDVLPTPSILMVEAAGTWVTEQAEADNEATERSEVEHEANKYF
jgi:hypothetical protein